MHDVATYRPSRFDYVKYDETAQAKQAAFKTKCQELEELVGGLIGDTPSRSARSQRTIENAFTALEVFYMWIGKAIRDEQVYNRTAELQEGRNNG